MYVVLVADSRLSLADSITLSSQKTFSYDQNYFFESIENLKNLITMNLWWKIITFLALNQLEANGLALSHHPVNSIGKGAFLSSTSFIKMSDDWSDFADLDDDDLPSYTIADENDPQELKAEIGDMMYAAPEVFSDAEPIFLPQGSVLELSEENVEGVLAACREEIGTLFGYSAENRGVGITGGVDFLYLDGPSVVVRLKGRFWHLRTTVLERVGAYIKGRIPEVIDVMVEDEWELSEEANNMAM